MHPIKAAINALHAASTKLHHASNNTDFDDHHKVMESIIGLLPEVITAAQELAVTVLGYFANR